MARTAGNGVASGLLFSGLCIAAVLQPAACDAPGGAQLPEESIALALRPVGSLIETELRQFSADLGTLDASLEAWALAAEAGDGVAALALARTDFVIAMDTWQRLEVLQVGPAASSLTAVGGEDLRDEVYSWPDAANGCQVDVETLDGQWEQADFFTTRLVHSYGLDALEHLLYAPLDTACTSQIGIDEAWNALDETALATRRAAFARAIVGHADGLALDLVDRWNTTLIAALEQGTAPWSSRSEALDEVFSALFYTELVTKDRKLAEPLGIRDCTLDCTTLVESRQSALSVRWVVQNLESLRTVTQAGPSDGFDALLVELGHGDIADALATALDEAISVGQSLEEEPLEDLITGNPAAATELHDAVKAVTDILRGDFATVLLLAIPGEAAGDND